MQFSNITTTMIFLCFNQLIQEKDMYVTCDFQDLIHPLHYNIGRNGEDTSARVLLRLIEYFFLLFLGGFILHTCNRPIPLALATFFHAGYPVAILLSPHLAGIVSTFIWRFFVASSV